VVGHIDFEANELVGHCKGTSRRVVAGDGGGIAGDVVCLK